MIPIFHSLFAWKESCVPARGDGSSYIPCLPPLVGGRGTTKWWRGRLWCGRDRDRDRVVLSGIPVGSCACGAEGRIALC